MADREAPTLRFGVEADRADPVHDVATQLPRRFQITDQLGEGATGVVVAAHDVVLRREVAIKVLHRHRDALEEARAAAELRHPAIVTIYDVDPGGRYIVMELIDGETLQQRLARRTRLPLAEVYELGRVVLGALTAAHERGIIHRDIKPANIMFDRKHGIKLNDFGVAHRMTSDELASAHDIAGTPAYMAPEIWEGAEPDARTDVFGVGVTLWEAAVGKAFRDDFTPEDFEARQVLEATGDPRLAAAVARALAVDPDARWASAAQFAAALGPRHAPRRTAWLVGVGLVGVAGIAIGAVSMVRGGDGAEPPRAQIVATMPFFDHARTGAGSARIELAARLAGELRHVRGLEVVGHDQMIARTSCTVELEDLAAWRACAETFHADAVVVGTLTPDGDRVAVELDVTRLDGTRLGRVVAHTAPNALDALIRRHAHEVADLIAGRARGDITVDPDLDLGIESLDQARYDDAERHFAAVLARDPGQADALYYTAIALSWKDAPQAEIDEAVRRALAAKLTPVQQGIVRGFQLLDNHELVSSIAHWKKLVEEFPADNLAQYGLVEALFHGGYPADAVVRYRQLAESDREFRLALMHPFDFYIAHGDAEGANWALARNQRFGIHSTEWEVRLRVMTGDLSGGYSMLAAEDAEAQRREQPLPFPPGLVTLAIARDDRAVALRAIRGQPPAELSVGLWLGDTALARRGLDRLLAGARVRGRRGAYDAARAAPMTSLSGDRAMMTANLAMIDRLIAGDPRVGVNEQLGRLFLVGTLGDKQQLAAYLKSPIPELARIATALVANLEGKPARADWQQAFALSADGMFVTTGKAHLARALNDAHDREGVLAVCGEILAPRIVDLAIGPATVQCLEWTGVAAEQLGRREQAIAAYRRLLSIRVTPHDPWHVRATAALARLLR